MWGDGEGRGVCGGCGGCGIRGEGRGGGREGGSEGVREGGRREEEEGGGGVLDVGSECGRGEGIGGIWWRLVVKGRRGGR